MNIMLLTRFLGWFSLALGVAEILMPATMARRLGLWGKGGLVRAYGVREVIAGVTTLAMPRSSLGPAARVAGDALDIAALVPALSSRNPHRGAAAFAFLCVAGITALDILATSSGNPKKELRRLTA